MEEEKKYLHCIVKYKNKKWFVNKEFKEKIHIILFKDEIYHKSEITIKKINVKIIKKLIKYEQ